ncbi:MAG: AraC family transcriptional regulator, partial [Roseburia sp.]|nr:AraC family transcriptional regulator [Roseburia sp.]
MKINLTKSPETQPRNDRHTFFMVKLAVSYSIFLLVILFLTFYLHQASDKNANQRFWSQNRSTFESAVTLLNSELTIMDSYCRQLTQDADFRRLAQMSEASGTDFYLSGRQLKDSLSAHLSVYSELPVNSYFIYLRNTNYVLSVNGFTTESLYYLHNYRFSSGELPSLDAWRELIYANNGTGSMYSLADYVLPGSDDAYLYLINMNALTSRNVPATAGFHISYSKLKDIFSGVSLEDGGCVVALDSQNTPFFVISEAGSIAENQNAIDSRSLAAALKELSFSDGYAALKTDGAEMHVTRISTDLNGLQYYLVQP